MIFLLIVSMLCIANDNAHLVSQQKFIVLTDTPRIAVDDSRIQLFSQWRDYLEDNPLATDIPVNFDTNIYNQLSTVIQTDGASFPARREDLQNLYLHAHSNGLKEEYLKHIADHAVYNFKEFQLASDAVKQALSSEYVKSNYKIGQLLKDEFWGKQLPRKTFEFRFISTAHFMGYLESRGFWVEKKRFFLIFPLKQVMQLKQSTLTIEDLKGNFKPIEIGGNFDSHYSIYEADSKLFLIDGNMMHVVDILSHMVESIEGNFAHIRNIVCDNKRKKAYAYYSNEYEKNKYDVTIAEWDLNNLDKKSLQHAPVVFERCLDKPLDIYWDKYFNELQWAYAKDIGNECQVMACNYRFGHQAQMQIIKLDKRNILISFIGNRIIMFKNASFVLFKDMITGASDSFADCCTLNCFTSNGILCVTSSCYLRCHGTPINIVHGHQYCFISNRFLLQDGYILFDLKEIKDAYKKLSGKKFYMQRIPKEEKVDVA